MKRISLPPGTELSVLIVEGVIERVERLTLTNCSPQSRIWRIETLYQKQPHNEAALGLYFNIGLASEPPD